MLKRAYLLFLLVPVILNAQVLNPDQLLDWIGERAKGEKSFVLIDVRTPSEHKAGFILGTDYLLPLGEIGEKISNLGLDPEHDTLVLYCRTGRRARIAQKELKKSGFRWVFNGQGIKQWNNSGFTLVKPQDSTILVPRSHVCVVKNTVEDGEILPVNLDGKTYYGCCASCIASFKNSPEKYRFAIDPVSEKSIDKAESVILDYKGRAIYFSSMKSLITFLKDPSKYDGAISE